MLIVIPQLLDREQARALGRTIAAAEWVDGNVTSGAGAALAKRNRQLPEAGEAAAHARMVVQEGLARTERQRNKGPAPRSLLLTLAFFPPSTCKGRHPAIGAGEAERHEIGMQLLQRPALLA